MSKENIPALVSTRNLYCATLLHDRFALDRVSGEFAAGGTWRLPHPCGIRGVGKPLWIALPYREIKLIYKNGVRRPVDIAINLVIDGNAIPVSRRRCVVAIEHRCLAVQGDGVEQKLIS
jgi:hypothetical protein